MRAIVVGGGDSPSIELISRYYDEKTILIAADGGANSLFECGLIPDYLLGDFDSIEPLIFETFKNRSQVITFPIEKDYTDSDLALNKAIEQGASEIYFFGCTGKRLDHFLGNLCMLYRALKKGVKAYIVDQYNKMFLVNESISLKGRKGQIFSILSYFEDVEGLSLSGAKYPLVNFDLKMSNNLTISNEFLENQVSIDFKKGVLLVMLSSNEV